MTKSDGKKHAVAMTWSGSSWTVDEVVEPSGAQESVLNAVSCTSEGICQAIGTFVDASGTTKTLAVRTTTQKWTVDVTPTPSGSTMSQLGAISCGVGYCSAVGSYIDSTGTELPWAIKWNGTSWASTAVTVPAGAEASRLNAVACTGASFCVSTGSYDYNSDELPFGERWNGTAWSLQTINAETLGATSTHIRSISCVTTTNCVAVGDLTYGHSASSVDLAYQYNGTTWVLTEADGYERLWTLSTLPPIVVGTEDDVACPSTSYCVRVGAKRNAADGARAQSYTWNGTAWQEQTVPEPSNANASELNGISCTSSTACTAVGDYVDGAGLTKTLALSWNGTNWSIATTPNPSGAATSELNGISCTSSTACTAVGDYVDGAGLTKTLALSWNGTNWSIATTPNPSGAATSELNGISCTSSTACTAVGDYVDGAGLTKTLALSWNGTNWSIATTPNPSGAATSELNGISCTSSTACTAVGDYVDGAGLTKTLALSWNGTNWSIATTPNPAGSAAAELSDVSCTGSECTTVGMYTAGGSTVMLALVWDGTAWSNQTTQSPARATESQLSGVSCISGQCMGVGRYVDELQITRMISPKWSGAKWPTVTPPNPTGFSQAELNQIACPSDIICQAVGSYVSSGVEKTLGMTRNGGTWTIVTTPNPSGSSAARLHDLSCTATTYCVAVGSYVASGTMKALAMSWNGTAWSIVTTPTPAFSNSATLRSVACVTTSNCVAVGSYEVGVETKTLAMKWNGTAWLAMDTPTPSGEEAQLDGISCHSYRVCIAVGSTEDAAGREVPLALNLETGIWSTMDAPTPGGATDSSLRDLSCSSDEACAAVGVYIDGQGASHGLSMFRTGDAWAWEFGAEPLGSTSVELSSVACLWADGCTAVGQYLDSTGAKRDVLMTWDGASWLAPRSIQPSGATATQLTGISCRASTGCSAVGSFISSGVRRTFGATGNVSITTVLRQAGIHGVSCVSPGACMAVGGATSGTASTSPKSIAWWLDPDRGWESLRLSSALGSSLSDVSCVSSSVCTAVGASSTGTVTGFWDGDKWTVQSTPNPSGTKPTLSGISCVGTTWCTSVGSYTNGNGQEVPLAERWAGSSWALQAPVVPTGALSSKFEDVSCLSSTVCTAVGHYDDANATHALAQRWNGTSWVNQAIPTPSGASDTSLSSVACSAASSCTAVGKYEIGFGFALTFVVRWNGTTWLLQASPNNESDASNRLLDVSCFASTRCLAVGTSAGSAGSAGERPLVMGWNGTAWSTETVPAPEGVQRTWLESVSCASTADCLVGGEAVNWDSASGSPSTSELLLQPHNENPDGNSEPILYEPTDPAPSLTLLQEQQAEALINDDPAVAAALDGEDYELMIGPWTETDSAGKTALVGAFAELTLATPQTWNQPWDWPAVYYPSAIEGGTYQDALLPATAENLEHWIVGLDASIDASGNFLDGEVVELQPNPRLASDEAVDFITPDDVPDPDPSLVGY